MQRKVQTQLGRCYLALRTKNAIFFFVCTWTFTSRTCWDQTSSKSLHTSDLWLTQKMQNIPFEASVLWLLSMWGEEIDRREKFQSIYLTDLCLLVLSSCFSPSLTSALRRRMTQEEPDTFLTTSNYFHYLVLQTDSESSKSEAWQAEVKVSMLEWGTWSQGFCDTIKMV